MILPLPFSDQRRRNAAAIGKKSPAGGITTKIPILILFSILSSSSSSRIGIGVRGVEGVEGALRQP